MPIEEIARKIAAQTTDQFSGGIAKDPEQLRLGLGQMDEAALRSAAAAQNISADDVAAFLAWLHPADSAQALGHSVRPFGDVQSYFPGQGLDGSINVREVLRTGKIDLPLQGNKVRLELHDTGLTFTESQRFCEMVLDEFARLVEGRKFKSREFDYIDSLVLRVQWEGEWNANVNENEMRQIKMAKIAAARGGENFSREMQDYYEIRDQRALIEIAKIAAAQNGSDTSWGIRYYRITDERALIEIAKIAAAQNGSDTSQYIQNYGITDQRTLIEIAKIAAAQDPGDTSFYIDRYGIIDQSALWDIASFLLLSLASPRVLTNISSLNPRLRLPPVDFGSNNTWGVAQVKTWLERALSGKGYDPRLAQILTVDVKKREVALMMALRLLFVLSDPEKSAELTQRNTLENQSRTLLSQWIGLDPALLENRTFSSQSLGRFYEQALQLQVGLMSPALEGIQFNADVFSDRSMNSLLLFFHSLAKFKNILGHPGIFGRDRELKKVIGDEIVSSATIGAITQRVNEEKFLRPFKIMFHLEGAPITMEMLEALESEWGDLDVFYTLAARFHGESNWKAEIPLLGRVVSGVLKGDFFKLKYEGLEEDEEDQQKAQTQLSMLADEGARQGWRANYQAASVFNTAGNETTKSLDALWKDSRPKLEEALGHLKEMDGSKEMDGGLVGKIKEAVLKEPKLATLKQYTHNKLALRAGVFAALKDADTVQEYQSVLRLMIDNDGLLGLNQQLKTDLLGLDQALKYAVKGNDGIVFTTTTDDPKLLLMTGDLVDASSCQNYRTGTHIETLLGYVVDANVQLILSYGLVKKHFASADDYEAAKKFIQAGGEVKFIAAKQMLQIGKVTVALPKATIRRVIKLGATAEKSAGLTMEREYNQNHFAEGEMRGQIAAVFNRLAEASKAAVDKPITIPSSRNPGGVYSDQVSGIQRSAYSMQPVMDLKPQVEVQLDASGENNVPFPVGANHDSPSSGSVISSSPAPVANDSHTPQSMLVESGHLMATPPMRMGHVNLVQSGNVLLQPAPVQVVDESEPPCGDLFRKMPQLRQRIVSAQEMLTNAKPFPYRETLIQKFNEILRTITRDEMNRLIIEIQDHDISPEGIIKSVAHLYFEGKDALQGWQSAGPARRAMPPGMAPANTAPLFGPKAAPAAAPPTVFH